jgi:hypothetical protein
MISRELWHKTWWSGRITDILNGRRSITTDTARPGISSQSHRATNSEKLLIILIGILLFLLAASIPAAIVGYLLFRCSLDKAWCVVATECFVLVCSLDELKNLDLHGLGVQNVILFTPFVLAIYGGYALGRRVHSTRLR